MKNILSGAFLFFFLGVQAAAAGQAFITGQREINESSATKKIEISYPVVSDPRLAREIDRFIKELVASFKSVEASPGGGPTPWDLSVTWESTQSPEFLNILLHISDYSGGAHPNQDMKTFSYSTRKNKIMNLDDIFLQQQAALRIIAKRAREILRAKLTRDDMLDEGMLNEGTEPIEKNFSLFTISNYYMTFYFLPYQVAAYAAGMQEAKIPLWDDEIQPLLKQ